LSKTDPKNNVGLIVPQASKQTPRRKFLKQGSAALASLGLAYRPAGALPEGTPVPGGVVDASTTVSQASGLAESAAGSTATSASAAAKGVVSRDTLKGYNILFVLVDQERYMGVAGLSHCLRMSD
jgi:hypothetical protein